MFFFFFFQLFILNLVARSAGLSKGYITGQEERHLQSPGLLTSSKAASPFVKKEFLSVTEYFSSKKWCVPLFTGKQLSLEEKYHTDLSLFYQIYSSVIYPS